MRVMWCVCEDVRHMCVSAGIGGVAADRQPNSLLALLALALVLLVASTCSRQDFVEFSLSDSQQSLTPGFTAARQLTRRHQHLVYWRSLQRHGSLCMVCRSYTDRHDCTQDNTLIWVIVAGIVMSVMGTLPEVIAMTFSAEAQWWLNVLGMHWRVTWGWSSIPTPSPWNFLHPHAFCPHLHHYVDKIIAANNLHILLLLVINVLQINNIL